ncbi:LAFE_0F03268g1_1 [Lachancea fermentati]|uniref:LAFE_0F03268g1_1 n=1 Tax=Lachancea fermentati TaxID=4955 RepID=A0A1G4MEW5_LACFM|nr:LAFE_0F03268g1_1 [Lachancea fermentati]
MSNILKNSTATVKLNTGATIPLLGLGTWRSTEEEAYNAVLSAIKDGYRHIDSAAIYGNEAPVGRAIRDSGVPREELFVTTKLWGTQHRDPKFALQESLKRLGLDYVDLYLMHWPVALKTANIKDGNYLTFPIAPNGKRDVDLDDWNFIKTWELLQELPATGKTKAVGVSNFSVNNLKDLLASPTTKVVPAANQVELHPYLPQEELVKFCEGKGIVIEAYSPLGSNGSPLLKDPVVIKIAEKYGVEPAQVLINWGLKRGYVILPKSVTPSRIASNFKVFELSDEDFEKINNISKENGIKRFVDPDWEGFETFV